MNKLLLSIIGCLFISSTFADTIGSVEYNLPDSAKDWEVGTKIQNEHGTTMVFIPKGVAKENVKEFFGVNSNSKKIVDINEPLLKLGLEKLYPNYEVNFEILNKLDDGVIYHWKVAEKDSGAVKVHGWGRAIGTPEGTVILVYQTQNVDDLEAAKSTWLQVLQEAKVIAPAAAVPSAEPAVAPEATQVNEPALK